MRLLIGVFAAGMVGVAAFQSVIGPSKPLQAESIVQKVADVAICDVAVATAPVLRSVMTEYVATEGYQRLSVTPSVFGTATEELTLTPAHREGATFRTEEIRIVTAEPTRRLRVIPPEFEPVPAFEPLKVERHHVQGGALVPVMDTIEYEALTRQVSRASTIMSVRLSAGIKMMEIRHLEKDGNGDPVPAQTMTIERRTVESHPAVASEQIEAIYRTAEIQEIVSPASVSTAPALCELEARPELVGAILRKLTEDGAYAGASDEKAWTPEVIDALAVWQEAQTGLIAPAPLLEVVPMLLPNIVLPTG